MIHTAAHPPARGLYRAHTLTDATAAFCLCDSSGRIIRHDEVLAEYATEELERELCDWLNRHDPVPHLSVVS